MTHVNRGFTLIELLVVVAIIGMLSSVVLASMNGARMKARDARRLADIKQIQTALEMYYNDYNSYPTQNWAHSNPSNPGTWSTLESRLEPYLSKLPSDPVNTNSSTGTGYSGALVYSYYAISHGGSGQWYMLVFRLETNNHPMQTQDGVTACDGTLFHYGSGSHGIITLGGSCG